MRKLLAMGGLLTMAGALLTGCASIERFPADKACRTGDGQEVIEYVDIQNTSWKLLSFIPIASGDIESPNDFSCCWFRNTNNQAGQMRVLSDEVKRVGGKKAVDVTSQDDDNYILFVLLKKCKTHTFATIVR